MRNVSLIALALVASLAAAAPALAAEEQRVAAKPVVPKKCTGLEGTELATCVAECNAANAKAKPPLKAAPGSSPVNTIEDIYRASFVDVSWMRAYLLAKHGEAPAHERKTVDPALIAWEVVEEP